VVGVKTSYKNNLDRWGELGHVQNPLIGVLSLYKELREPLKPKGRYKKGGDLGLRMSPFSGSLLEILEPTRTLGSKMNRDWQGPRVKMKGKVTKCGFLRFPNKSHDNATRKTRYCLLGGSLWGGYVSVSNPAGNKRVSPNSI